MADIYSNLLYQENKRLHSENKAIKEWIDKLIEKERPFMDYLTHPDSIKITRSEGVLILEIRSKDVGEFKIFCSDVTFEI